MGCKCSGRVREADHAREYSGRQGCKACQAYFVEKRDFLRQRVLVGMEPVAAQRSFLRGVKQQALGVRRPAHNQKEARHLVIHLTQG